MNRILASILACVVLATGGCVISDPSPYAHGLLQPGYNKAWNNAIDAMKDEGVSIVLADLARGELQGKRGGVSIDAHVVTQKLGDVRVQFVAPDDPGLAERVEQRYQARMGK